MRRAWLQLLLVSLLAAVGCAKKEAKPDVQPVEQTTSTDPVDLDAVSSEALGEAPCGNPDWSRLPPGSQDQ